MIAPPMASVRRLVVIAGALAVLALAFPGARASAADGPTFGLRVFTGDNPTAAIFRSANCRVKNNRFSAFAHDGDWQLIVQIQPFMGFHHRYALVRGYYNGTFLSVSHGNQPEYASDFVPPYHIPSGGQINFSRHGKLMGGGFYPTFNQSGTDAVGVAGGLKCHYPRRKR